MRTLHKFIVPAIVLLAMPAALATDQIAKDTGLKCTACHDKAGSRLLTDQGKYFESMGTLDGFDDLSATFGKCTTCHVRKPGSNKLTKQGKRFADVVGGMDELREWLDESHPTPALDDVLLPRGKAKEPPVALVLSH